MVEQAQDTAARAHPGPADRDGLFSTGVCYVYSPMETGRAETARGEVTLLLNRVSNGERDAEVALLPRVYFELHRLALSRLKTERRGHTLQATALVNEAYLRLCGAGGRQFENRAHFFRLSARMMRRILVDYARKRGASRRNGGGTLCSLDEAIVIAPEQSDNAVRVDELLEELARLNARQAQVVEMKFYGGLNEAEIAAALGIHIRTVRRDWLLARAWLHEQLSSSVS